MPIKKQRISSPTGLKMRCTAAADEEPNAGLFCLYACRGGLRGGYGGFPGGEAAISIANEYIRQRSGGEAHQRSADDVGGVVHHQVDTGEAHQHRQQIRCQL